MKYQYRNNCLEFNIHSTNFGFQYGVGGYFDRRHMVSINLLFMSLYAYFPWGQGEEECDAPRYGFYYFEKSLWFPWGRKIRCIHMPYSYDWIRTSALREDGLWEHEVKGDSKDFWDDKWKGILWEEVYLYTYVLNNGDLQNRRATVRVEEREWRQKWLKWTSLFSKVRRTISIDFDGEVGERTGSWKGGTVGCGYDLQENETPLQCLRRMEKERKF